MKVMVVGGGGREHAIIKKLKENTSITEIFALPGNGGIAKDATCVDIGAKDIPAIVDFAVKTGIDYEFTPRILLRAVHPAAPRHSEPHQSQNYVPPLTHSVFLFHVTPLSL